MREQNKKKNKNSDIFRCFLRPKRSMLVPMVKFSGMMSSLKMIRERESSKEGKHLHLQLAHIAPPYCVNFLTSSGKPFPCTFRNISHSYREMFPILLGNGSFPLFSGKLFPFIVVKSLLFLLGKPFHSHQDTFPNFPISTVKQHKLFQQCYLGFFANQDKMRKSFKEEILPKRFKRGKLFPDDFPQILKNIHPCLGGLTMHPNSNVH